MIAPNVVLEAVRPEHVEMVSKHLRSGYTYVPMDVPTTDGKRYYNYMRYWMRLNGWISSDTPYLFDRGHITELATYGHVDTALGKYASREEQFNCRLTQETALFRPTVIVYLKTSHCSAALEFKYSMLAKLSRIPCITVELYNEMGCWNGWLPIINEINEKIEAL